MSSAIINVIIVLLGIYIALSLACSWLQEQVAALMKLRASTLRKGIVQLVSGDADVLARIGEHPLFKAASSEAKPQFPSYVEARNFTLAFWQAVGPVASAPLGKALTDPKDALDALVAAVNDWAPATDTAKDIKKTAVALLTSAEGDFDKLLKTTDAWFNAQMDRVSGWYKRNTQYFLIVIAFLLAVGLGVDTIDIGRQLYAAPALSEGVAQSISAAVKNHEADPKAGVAAVGSTVAQAQDLQALHLVRPFWWASKQPATGVLPAPTSSERLFGMLITAIALSLGAPFWFDVLNGLCNVRMAGQKPADAPAPTASPSK